MSVPTRPEAARILRELDPPEWLVTHSVAVAEVAAYLAERIGRATAIDPRLVEAAALLHDVDKALPEDHPLRPLGHGDAGAAWLTERGYGELARAVANHPATRLSDEDRYPRWAAFASREERIVAYADKRAMQDVVPMDERFADWARRHPEHGASLAVARRRAERLERDVCAAANVQPEEVTRLAWAADELAAVVP
jgi:putative nucleotidyltransferase with HDIG domain